MPCVSWLCNISSLVECCGIEDAQHFCSWNFLSGFLAEVSSWSNPVLLIMKYLNCNHRLNKFVVCISFLKETTHLLWRVGRNTTFTHHVPHGGSCFWHLVFHWPDFLNPPQTSSYFWLEKLSWPDAVNLQSSAAGQTKQRAGTATSLEKEEVWRPRLANSIHPKD